jgi:Ca2+-binding EF-hand superfamily protein
MMSNPFDPEDIREIEEAFARVDGEVNGYVLVPLRLYNR